MFLKYFSILFLAQSTLQFSLVGEDWINQASKRVDENTAKWFRELISQEKLSKSSSNPLSKNEIETLAKKKCQVGEGISSDNGFDVFVFLSFSAPEEIWLDLSKELQKVNGAIVVRGLPQNSFKEFYQKLKNLDQKGFSAHLQINPKLFEKYSIDKVPTFVVSQGSGYDKVSGNISLFTALELLAKTGNSDKGSNLFYEYKLRRNE